MLSEHQKLRWLSAMSIGNVLRIRVAEEDGELGLITCVLVLGQPFGQGTPASGCAWALAPTSCHECGRR